MSSTEFDENSSEEELVAYCADAPASSFLRGSPYSIKVVKLGEYAVIKFGWLLDEKEAENQRRAYELVDRRVVRVPRVLRFFVDSRDWGFLVMEYVDGKIIDPLEDVTSIQSVARVMSYFATLRGQLPGPLSRGPCRGLLFPDTDDLCFDDAEEMESWFNTRIRRDNLTISLRDCDLVLCHLDIAPRNILWQPDGSICLLDWTSAGFYPRLFEFGAQWIIEGFDGNFNKLLLNAMEPLSEHEMKQKSALMFYWRNIQRFHFAPTKYTKVPKEIALGDVKEAPKAPKVRAPVPPMPPYPAEWLELFKFQHREDPELVELVTRQQLKAQQASLDSS